jgi:hypothetical protein
LLGVLACSTAALPAPEPTAAPTEPLTGPATQEPVITEAPTEPPPACVTLLTPENGADLPATGKVIFSWAPMAEAGSYILNIILPSGEVLTFETNGTFRDRYMEAFAAGGKYGWQVTAQDTDGNEICISEAFAFDKPEQQKPTGGCGGGGGSGGKTDGGGSTDGNTDE